MLSDDRPRIVNDRFADISDVKTDILILAAYLSETRGIARSVFESPFGLHNEVIAETPAAIERLHATRLELTQLARPVTVRQLRITGAFTDEKRAMWAPPRAVMRLRGLWAVVQISCLCLAALALAGSAADFIIGKNAPASPSGWSRTVLIWSQFTVPALYGGLGAAVSCARTFAAAVRNQTLDERLGAQVNIGLALGFVSGTMVGLWSETSTGVFTTAFAFLAGYGGLSVLAWLDLSVLHVFRPSNVGAIDLLKPVNLTTHFLAGASFTLLFLAGCGLLSDNTLLRDTLSATGQSLVKPPPPIGPPLQPVILLGLSAIGGTLGAWLRVTIDIIASMTSGQDSKPPNIPVPFLQYLTGAAAGAGLAFIVPGSLLRSDHAAITEFNPFALAVVAILGGYFIAHSLRSVVGSVDRLFAGGGVAAVEMGVRQAFKAPPLINYNGHLTASLLEAATLSSCMEGDLARLKRHVPDYLLELRLVPAPIGDVASTHVTVSDGVDGSEAVFDIEISADALTPRRRQVQVAARSGITIAAEPLKYTLSPDSELTALSRFRFTVSQAGRVIQFGTLRIAMAEVAP